MSKKEHRQQAANEIITMIKSRIETYEKLLNEDEYTKSDFALQQTIVANISLLSDVINSIEHIIKL